MLHVDKNTRIGSLEKQVTGLFLFDVFSTNLFWVYTYTRIPVNGEYRIRFVKCWQPIVQVLPGVHCIEPAHIELRRELEKKTAEVNNLESSVSGLKK